MIFLVICVWGVYWASALALPFIYVYGAIADAMALQFIFVCSIVFGYYCVNKNSINIEKNFTKNELIVCYFGIVISIVGLIFLAYDKIALQGIDYSGGVASAREQWRRVGEERTAPSSIFSVAGYAIGSAYFVSSAISLFWANRINVARLYAINTAAFIICVAGTALTGGRSVLILYVVFCLIAFVANPANKIRHLLPGPIATFFLMSAVGVVIAYSLFVIQSRSQANDLQPLAYAYNFLPYLGIYLHPDMIARLGTGMFADVGGVLSIAAGYFVHSLSTFGAILESPERSGNVLFTHILTLGDRLGFWDAPASGWFLSGRFASVPGLLWLQFGGWAILLGGLVLGLAIASFQRWVQASPAAIIPVMGLVALGSIAILSPLSFAADFLAFPFIIVGSVIMEVARITICRLRPERGPQES